MSEDLLDLSNLPKEGSNLSQANPAPETTSPSPTGVVASNTANLNDLWGLASPAAASSPSIPRFAEAPPYESSPLAFAPLSASAASTPSKSPSPSPILASSTTGSTMSQLQDLWYPPNTTPTSLAPSAAESSPVAAKPSSLPPAMSLTPPPSESNPETIAPAVEKLNLLPDSHSSSATKPSDLSAPQAESTGLQGPNDQHLSASLAASNTATAGRNPPPFQIWSPAPSMPSIPAQAPPQGAQSAVMAPSSSKYSVTTVANPPGSVESENFLVMKDMLKTMADMTRRMLNMEERISRLEMEKEQLSRTVNRLQETQHQQMIRQEVPKPQAIPQMQQMPPMAYPPHGYPPGYGSVTSTYSVPPGYGAPVPRYDPVKRG